MNIQFNQGILSYQSIGKTGTPPYSAPPAKAASIPASNLSAPPSDKVTISAAAAALSAKESATQARTPAQEDILKSASSDPQSAELLSSQMADTPSTIFFDIRGVGGGEALTKLSSGRVIDDAFKNKFANEASVIDAQRKAIYDSEKAKGSPPVDILSKMIDFTNTQSRDYLEASGWLNANAA